MAPLKRIFSQTCLFHVQPSCRKKNGPITCCVLSYKGFFGGGANGTYLHQKLADEPTTKPFLLQRSIKVLLPIAPAWKQSGGGGEAQHVLNNAAQAILGSQRFMTEGSQEISLLVQLEKSHFTIFVSLFPSLRHQRGTKRKQLRRLTRAGENVNICQIWVVGKYMAICYIDLYVFLNV